MGFWLIGIGHPGWYCWLQDRQLMWQRRSFEGNEYAWTNLEGSILWINEVHKPKVEAGYLG